MIKIENHIGSITVTENYIRQVVEHTVLNCFGVVGMCPVNPADALISKFFPQYSKNGILICIDNKNNIIIDLHIAVSFGTNIKTIVKSVSHKVKFAMNQALRGVNCKVNIFVDDIN